LFIKPDPILLGGRPPSFLPHSNSDFFETEGFILYIVRNNGEHVKLTMQTFDNFSNADININSPNDDVTINQKIDDHSRGTIICRNLTIGQKIDQHSADADDAGAAPLQIQASGSVFIGQKIDQHCKVVITAVGTVHIGQKIDQHCAVTITAANLIIDQGISQHCVVRYRVTGTANLGSIDGNCDVQRF
jgi:hypothetical protein